MGTKRVSFPTSFFFKKKGGIYTERPVSPDRIVGSGVDPSRSSIFLKLSADKLLVFK